MRKGKRERERVSVYVCLLLEVPCRRRPKWKVRENCTVLPVPDRRKERRVGERMEKGMHPKCKIRRD